ncbi:MAG: GTP 3',8-cyclase MoaA [Sandaracinus sp.]
MSLLSATSIDEDRARPKAALHVLGPPRRGCSDELTPIAPAPERPRDFEIPTALVDAAGRRVRYVRLSVTDRCDLACTYCMPPHGERAHARREELLDFDEIVRLARVLHRMGVERLRLTGGEPLVRRGVPELVARLHTVAPSLALTMTTNGTRLGPLAASLAQSGLSSVNVSLDSLDPQRFAAITRGGSLDLVLAGIEAARAAGLEVKLNTVLQGEASLGELPALIAWAWARGLTPRFIELMPMGEASSLPSSDFIPIARARERLSGLVEDGRDPSSARGPARYLVEPRTDRRVGLIAAASEPFCEGCNRIRLTARGELRGCLGHPHGVALRPVLRHSGSDDRDLAWALVAGLSGARRGHEMPSIGARLAASGDGAHARVGMSLVGG